MLLHMNTHIVHIIPKLNINTRSKILPNVMESTMSLKCYGEYYVIKMTGRISYKHMRGTIIAAKHFWE